MTTSANSSVELPENFSQPVLGEFKTQLDEKATGGGKITLDGKSVEQIDSAGLQFLLAFAGSPIAGVPSVENMSDLTVAALSDIGVTQEELKTLFDMSVAS